MQTRDVVEGLHNFREGYVNMEKVLYRFYKIILKIRANLKRHNRVSILSSKHSYRPMRERVVPQLFYNYEYYVLLKTGSLDNAIREFSLA